MAIAAHLAVVSVATGASSPPLTLDGCNSFTLSDGSDLLDTTDFSAGRMRQRIVGLRDVSGSLDCDLELADLAFQLVRGAYVAGNPVYLRIKPDGTNGIMVPMLIESLERSGSVEDKVSLSISMSTDGSLDPIFDGTGI